MRIQPNLFSSSSTIQQSVNPYSMHMSRLSNQPKCPPITRLEQSQESFYKEEKDDYVNLNQAFRYYAIGMMSP